MNKRFLKINESVLSVLLMICLIYPAGVFAADSLDVTFRYVPDPGEEFVRIFVPGTMPADDNLDWGPNDGGRIDPDAPSLMSYDSAVAAYTRTYTLELGSTHEYKFHLHYNSTGTEREWISDPRNPETDGTEFNDSVIEVADPLLFQPALHLTGDNSVRAMSVGIFTSDTIESVTYIAGNDTSDGTGMVNAEGVFYTEFDTVRSRYAGFEIRVVIGGEEYLALNQEPIIVTEAPVPEEFRHGPNAVDGGAGFVLHAPGRSAVRLHIQGTGSVSDIDTTVMMALDPDESDLWWRELTLPQGQYEYEYLMLDGTRISDPLSRRVRNGKTVIEVGPGGVTTADDYQWESREYTRPAMDTLIIYELHVDDFAAQGSSNGRFTHVIDRLDYLDSLGINAIELMPVTEFPGDRSWGYNPTHFAAVEATYGTPEDFKRLVDEAHKRGIAVIFDIVWNHMDSSGPLWNLQPDYEETPYFKTGRYYENEATNNFGMLDLDHFTEATQRFVRQVHRIWVEEYRIDGFRFDYTRGIGWTLGQRDRGILGWSTALREAHPDVYQIAEHLAADPVLINVSDLDAGWNDSFHDQLLNDIHGPRPSMNTVEAQVLGLHEYQNEGNTYQGRTATVKATVTHDEQSFIQEMVVFKDLPLETALRRDKMYSMLLFTAQGVPMIWQGQELGMQSGWFDEDGDGNWDEHKLSYRPMNWALRETDRGQSHFHLYQRLMKLRKQNPSLRDGEYVTLKKSGDQRVIIYGYRAPDSSKNDVVVMANFSGSERTVSDIHWRLSTGDWFDVVSDTLRLTVASDTIASVTIPPHTAQVLSPSHLTDVRQPERPSIPEGYVLRQNYPNPFNGSTTIRYGLPEPADVSLEVYNLTGQRVVRYQMQSVQPGYHTLQLRADDFASGVYLYMLRAAGEKERFHQVKKLVILK